jgi:hypothetical protein
MFSDFDGVVPAECKLVDDNFFGWLLRRQGIGLVTVTDRNSEDTSVKSTRFPKNWFELHVNTNRNHDLRRCSQYISNFTAKHG